MAKKSDQTVEDVINHKLGLFVEHLNDQTERILEAVASGNEELSNKMDIIDVHLEKVEKSIAELQFDMRIQQRDLGRIDKRVVILESTT